MSKSLKAKQYEENIEICPRFAQRFFDYKREIKAKIFMYKLPMYFDPFSTYVF